MTFKSHREIQEAEVKILSLIYLSEINVNILRESDLNEGFTSWLKDVGLNLKQKPGVIDYAMNFTSGIGMILLAALKRDKAKVKAIAQAYSKEDFVDFLLSLDELTLGLLTAPLNFISALTGWELTDALKNASKTTKKALADIKTAINNIKSSAQKILDKPKQAVINTHLKNIETNMPI